MIFRDRIDAGQQLVADGLQGEFDVVLIRKLHAPGNPEFAVGAVDETGWSCIADYAARAGATPEYLEREIAALGPHCDEVVCLDTPRGFYAVGQFYRDFTQVDDAEVVGLLREVGARTGPA